MLEKDKDMKKDCYKQVSTMGSKDEKPFGGYDPFNCEKLNKTKKEWTVSNLNLKNRYYVIN